jgi:hypothetical protein
MFAALIRGAVATAMATLPETIEPLRGCWIVAPPPLAKAAVDAPIEIMQANTKDEIVRK